MTDKELQEMITPDKVRAFFADPANQVCIKDRLYRHYNIHIDEDEQVAGRVGSTTFCPLACYIACSVPQQSYVSVSLSGISCYINNDDDRSASIDTPGWAQGLISYVDSYHNSRKLMSATSLIMWIDHIMNQED